MILGVWSLKRVEVKISSALLNGLVGWWKFDEGRERLLMIQAEMEMMEI